jgi:hypothetical protein
MASRIVKGFHLLRNKESISPAVMDLMDLRTKSMADFFLKKSMNPGGWLHGALQPFHILQPLSTNQRTDCHNGPRKGPAGFTPQGHSSSKCTPRLEDILASNIKLFLQGCKNGLCSPMVVHLILKRQFEDLTEQLLFVHNRSSPLTEFLTFLPLLIT